MKCRVCGRWFCDDPLHRFEDDEPGARKWKPKSALFIEAIPLAPFPMVPEANDGALLFGAEDRGPMLLFDSGRSLSRRAEQGMATRPQGIRSWDQIAPLFPAPVVVPRTGESVKVNASFVKAGEKVSGSVVVLCPGGAVDLKLDVGFQNRVCALVIKPEEVQAELGRVGSLNIERVAMELPTPCTSLVLKWREGLVIRQKYLETHILSPSERGRLSRLAPSATVAEHDLTHYGEIPHTLRHWLRGGKVKVDCRDVRIKASWREGMTAQWSTMLNGLKEGAAQLRMGGNLFSLDVHEGSVKGEKIKHTDLQYFQVCPSPLQFITQLNEELCFPSIIRLTPGYAEVEQDVALLWKKAYGGKPVGVIMWVRFVATGPENGNDNRPIFGYELDGCLQAAKELGSKLGCKRVLVLGDDKGLERFDVGPKGDDVSVLLGEHMTRSRDGKRRSQLEQLQFLTAIVRVSGARLVLGERSGSVDKLSLCGGVPCSQFVGARVRQGNERLDDVYVLGCGMGFKVDLLECTKVMQVKSAIVKSGLMALDNFAEITRALAYWHDWVKRRREEGL